MRRRRRRRTGSPLTKTVAVAAVLVLALWTPPTASFTVGEADNGQSVGVVSDIDGSVSLNKTAELDDGVSDNCLVRVTNRLGADATVRVSLSDDSKDLGTLKTDGGAGGDSVEFTLLKGGTETVYMDVNDGTDGNTTRYTVNATGGGSEAVLSGRSSPIEGTAEESCR